MDPICIIAYPGALPKEVFSDGDPASRLKDPNVLADTTSPQTASVAVPISAGLLTALVGFASSFAVVLAGLQAVGASPEQAASGLIALCAGQGVLMLVLAWRARTPLSFAWSTPGAALLVSTGMPESGFPEAVGAFLVAALLIAAAGLWRAFGRAVEAIPTSLASAMLAGVLLDLCLAPVRALEAMPWQAAAIIGVWAVTWRLARLYAVMAAVLIFRPEGLFAPAKARKI